MEEGERDDLAEYREAAGRVDRALDASATFDEGEEQDLLRAVERKWQAADRQLQDTRTGVGSSRDDAADPEDVFEAHLNSAIGGVGGLVKGSQREIRSDLAATRRLNRAQSLVALVALLTSLAIAPLLARHLAAAALRPIHRLTQAARAFGSGHLGHRVGVTSSAELTRWQRASTGWPARCRSSMANSSSRPSRIRSPASRIARCSRTARVMR